MKLSSSERVLVQSIRAAYLSPDAANSVSSVSGADWRAVLQQAQRHRLAPMLYGTLKAREHLDQVPEEVDQELRAAYFRSYVANMFAYEELGRLLVGFDQEQIPVILLKGCALAVTIYPDMGLRPMVDLDILVPEAQVDCVSDLLTQQGYAPFVETVIGFQRALRNEQAFSREGRIPIAVDVHWHLMAGKYYSTRIPVAWFWERTTQATVGEQTARVLLPEAQLLQLAAHLALHHSGEGMLWSFDIALLLERYRDRIDWDEVIEAAHSFGLDQIVKTTLAQVFEIWGVSVPDRARFVLKRDRPSVTAHLLSVVHTAAYDGTRATWDALSTPGFRNKLAYLRLLVFPSSDYMRERYAVSDTRWLPLYYIRRIGTGTSMLLRSVFSIAINAIRVFGRPQIV